MNFDAIYKQYPRKEGKALGRKKFLKQIKTKEQYDSLLRAVANYSHLVRDRDRRYIKMFSSFMSEGIWEEYCDIELPSDSLEEFLNEKD